MSDGFSTGPTRNSLIKAASDLLLASGIEWSPNKIINAVKEYEKKGHGQTLSQFLAQKIAREIRNIPTSSAAVGFVRIGGKRSRRYSDPTGNTAVRNVQQEHAAMSQKFVSLKTAADEVGVSVTSLRRYIAEGRITAYRVGPRLIKVELDQVKKELFSRPVNIA